MTPHPDREAVRAASPIERVIPELLGEHAIESGGELKVKCPFHEDRRPSLRINAEKQVWRCDPCNRGGDAFEFVQALKSIGFKEALQFLGDRSGVTVESTKKNGRIVAEYDYRDEQGVLLSQTVRYDPKGFQQRRPDGRGGWIWNRKDVRRVLYRLPDLQGEEAVVIVEGEKDVEACWKVGIAATCNIGGTGGGWHKEDTQQLKAAGVRRVRIIPDADQPGRRHAEKIELSCVKAGIEPRIVVLPDVSKSGADISDVSDYLASYGKEELLALLKAAPTSFWATAGEIPANEPRSVEPTPAATAASAVPFGPVVTRLSDVQSERVAWLWRRRLAKGKLTLLMGDPGAGKSMITGDVASRVTQGGAWPDAGHAEQPGNVIFLAVEDGIADTIRPRLERAGADLERVYVFTTIRDEAGERLPNFERDMATLEEVIVKLRPVLVVVDPVSSYLGKTDSYKDAEIRRVLAPLTVLADKHRVAVLALIHMTKGSKEAKAMYRAIGSIAFAALARIVLAAGSDPEEPERHYLMAVKQNICAPSKTLAYRIQGEPDDEDAAPWLEWEGAPVEGIQADVILGANASAGTREERQDTSEFLRQLLTDGRMSADDVFEAGKANGYSASTLNHAKRSAGVRSYKEGFKGRWYWELDGKIAPKVTMLRDSATFGENTAANHVKSTTSSKIASASNVATFAAPSTDEDSDAGLI